MTYVLVLMTFMALGAAFFYGRRSGRDREELKNKRQMVIVQQRILANVTRTVAEREDNFREISDDIHNARDVNDLRLVYDKILRHGTSGGDT